MNVIITGEVGIGKTTVCQKVTKLLQKNAYVCAGIIATKVFNGTNIKGINITDIENGKQVTLATVGGCNKNISVGRYYFNPKGITFGIRALMRGPSADVMIVDELGYLELRGEGFSHALQLIKTNKVKNSISIVRTELLPLITPLFAMQPAVFYVDTQNRDTLPIQIYSFLGGILTEQ